MISSTAAKKSIWQKSMSINDIFRTPSQLKREFFCLFKGIFQETNQHPKLWKTFISNHEKINTSPLSLETRKGWSLSPLTFLVAMEILFRGRALDFLFLECCSAPSWLPQIGLGLLKLVSVQPNIYTQPALWKKKTSGYYMNDNTSLFLSYPQ